MNAADEEKPDEPLAGLLTGMLGEGARRGVGILRLGPEHRLRRRWPLAVAIAAAVTLAALIAAGAILYLRARPSGEADRTARPVVQPVPSAMASPSAFVAVAPPPPVAVAAPAHRSLAAPRRSRVHTTVRRSVGAARQRVFADDPYRDPPGRGWSPGLRAPDDEEFGPPDRAFRPYPAVPLGSRALRRALAEDRRRTRDLNRRELRAIEEDY